MIEMSDHWRIKMGFSALDRSQHNGNQTQRGRNRSQRITMQNMTNKKK